MLNPSNIHKSFRRVLGRIRGKFVITVAVISAIKVLNVSNVSALERETILEFKNLAGRAQQVAQESRVVDANGNVRYEFSERERDSLDKDFKRLIKRLEREAEEDIKNQEWQNAEKLIGVFYNFLRALGYDGRAEEMLKIKQKIHEDFVAHIDLGREGIYTLKGSGRVFVVASGSSRRASVAQREARSNAERLVMGYIGSRSATIRGFVRFSAEDRERGGVTDFRTLMGFASGGSITADGRKISEKDIASRLESEGRLLPLN